MSFLDRLFGRKYKEDQHRVSEALIAGRYEVAGRPLMGGMGIVYLCFDHKQHRPVALKTLRPEFLRDREARDRLLREGTVWVNLGYHPHIARCYGVIRPRRALETYLVLELVAKEERRTDASLRSWLVPGHPLAIEQALLFGLQIVRGMRHSTATVPGLVHRDLKPENILVGADRLSSMDFNRLRVTDFGIVAVLQEIGTELNIDDLDSDPTRRRTLLTRGIIGTPEYMAPEQWEDRDIDVRADIYAFGCILVEMLTGEMPVRADPRLACRRLHQEGQALKVAGRLPRAVASVLAGFLAVNPSDRFDSWGEAEEALGAAFAEVTGRTTPEPEPVKKQDHSERTAMGWAYSTMGFSYLDIGKLEVALKYFDQAHAIARDVGDRQVEGNALSGCGIAYFDMGDTRKAINFHEQALALARETGPPTSEAYCLSNLGLAYANLGEVQQAIGLHEQALAIAHKTGDWGGEGSALNNLGEAYINLGDAKRAIGVFKRALSIWRKIGDRSGEIKALGNLGNANSSLGDVRQALRFYEQARGIAREIGDWNGEANALGNIGNAYFMQGKEEQAIDCYERCLTIHREVGDRRGEGGDLGNLGSAYYRLGDAQRAIRLYEQQLIITREIGDKSGEGKALGNMGNAYRRLGKLWRAVEFHGEAASIFREIGDRRGEGITVMGLGAAYEDIGDSQRAIKYWEQASNILDEVGDSFNFAITDLNLARLLSQQGSLSEALPLAQRAAQIFGGIGHSRYKQQAQQLAARIQSILR